MENLESQDKYRLVLPEGGWGHLITLSVIVINMVLLLPKVTFGLLYGDFLTSLGDPTKSTSVIIGIYNTVVSLSGILASLLLSRYSYRKVAFLGSVMFSLGAIGLIFVSSEYEMYFYYGILQGIGCGLSFPASFTALNVYFDNKLSLMVGISRVGMIFFSIVLPHLIVFLNGTFGFKVTLGFMAIMTLLQFPAAWVLHPVKWHMNKILIDDETSGENLLKKDTETYVINGKFKEEAAINGHGIMNGNKSVVKGQKKKVKILDFSLLKNIRFLNMSCGLALAYTSDVCFYTIIPILLNSVGFGREIQATMTTVFFMCDLITRIAFSVACIFFKIRNRYFFLAGSTLSALFRIVFTLRDDYWWRIVTLGILGSLRSYIQVAYSLVISDEYREKFSTAFSLTLFICGVVNAIIGPLMSYVKTATGSDVFVAHVLTVAFIICSVCWTIEIIYDWSRKKSRTKVVVVN